jgi:hypothetical protein
MTTPAAILPDAEGGDVDPITDTEVMMEEARQQRERTARHRYKGHREINPNMFLAGRGYDPHSDTSFEVRQGAFGEFDPDMYDESVGLADGGRSQKSHRPAI